VRDGKHAGPGGLDDRKAFSFEVNGPNDPPIITDLTSDKTSPQALGVIITWTANATDADVDQILYRFFQNDEPITDWRSENSWTWATNDEGTYQVQVQVRDGKHAGPNDMDDQRSERFEITAPVPVLKPQETPKTWQKTFGGPNDDYANSVQQTSDGGYILAGTTNSFGDISDAWLIKTDAEGNEVWSRTFGGADVDWANSVQQTSDGGYIIAGGTSRLSTIGGVSLTVGDAKLIKTDVEGNEAWSRTFGGAGDDNANSVQQTSDGGYILAGTTMSFGAGCADAWLIKTDAEGNEAWSKTFGDAAYNDWANSVQQTSDGGYILAGRRNSYPGAPPGDTSGAGPSDGISEDAWLIKTDAKGNEAWSKTFGGVDGDWASSVQQTSDGGYILAGDTMSFGAGSDDVWLIKTDVEGNEAWSRTFGGAGDDNACSVQQTSDGGYILAGTTMSFGDGSDAWLIKTDAEGNEVWSRTFRGTGIATSVQQTSDGGYILTDWTRSFGAGLRDARLIKTDAEGRAPSSPDDK
jgi:hypothetical protein